MAGLPGTGLSGLFYVLLVICGSSRILAPGQGIEHKRALGQDRVAHPALAAAPFVILAVLLLSWAHLQRQSTRPPNKLDDWRGAQCSG
jgi:hypothetical protein